MPHTVYRFADCRIDVSARELRRAGELVVLSPKVFDCLAYLIERHDRAVGRDELVASVWGKTEITDTLLGQTILKARRAVGDSADEQKVIRTIPRFGYAWAAPLSDEADGPSAPASTGQRAIPRHRIAWIIVATLVIGVGLWLGSRLERKAVIPAAAGTAAVLPVDVEAPAEWSWVRLGLMDAIASRLRAGAQSVIPSDNVIALTRSGEQSDHRSDVRAATGATLLVVPSAAWNPSGWSVHLELRGKGPPVSVDAHNADVLLAGRAAADRLLKLLGKVPPPDASDPQGWSNAKLLQRVEADVLTNDLAGARRLLESAPEELKRSPEYGLRLAHVEFRAGEFDAADRRLHALLAQAPNESDPVLRARILNGIGHVAMRLGHTDRAMASYVEAASLLQDRDEPDELGQAYMGRGIAAQALGDDQQARAAYSKARIAFDIAGDALALARTEANEGMLEAARDRFATAAGTLDRAAERFESFGTLNELAMTVNVDISTHLALLEPREALAASDRAWPSHERLSNLRIRHALAINRAVALDANGRRSEAVPLLEDVGANADPARETSIRAAARAELARIYLASGRAQDALDLALEAVPVLIDADSVRDRSAAWLTLTRALRAVGRSKEAGEQVERFGDWARSSRQPAAVLFAALALAEQQSSAANGRTEANDYERALELASEAAVPSDIAAIAISYGRYLLSSGQLERATEVVGRIAQWSDRDLDCALLQVRLYSALGRRPAWEHALATARRVAGDRAIPPDAAVFAGGIASGSL